LFQSDPPLVLIPTVHISSYKVKAGHPPTPIVLNSFHVRHLTTYTIYHCHASIGNLKFCSQALVSSGTYCKYL